MSGSSDGNKHISLSMSNIDQLCPVAKALSSPMRVRMLALLGIRSMNVNELAEALSLPVSTAALNVRQLEDAGLIATAIQPGIRGAMKLCSRRIDSVSMRLTPEPQDAADAITVQLPIGSYSCADAITAPCGMVSDHGWIGESDVSRTFYHPDRLGAQLIEQPVFRMDRAQRQRGQRVGGQRRAIKHRFHLSAPRLSSKIRYSHSIRPL